MNRAFELAKEAYKQGEVPIGCVIVQNGKIIAESHNRSAQDKDATKHAELLAIEEASKILKRANLNDCDLYVTLEPCPMCAGAIINSKIRKVIFGAFDLSYGACGSAINLFSLKNIHTPEYYGGIMEDACSELITEFFKNIRSN